MLSLLLLLFAAYLVGSLSFAVIVSRAMGLPDPHSYGSGNPGATNVLRSGSRVAAALTLAGDALKGLVVLLLARQLPPEYGIGGFELALAGLAAFLGHLYPVFFGFRGGKGVATAGGVLFGLSPWLGLGILLCWLATFLATRMSSAGALAAAVVAPLLALVVPGDARVAATVLVMSALLVWRHRENIRRLRAGTEGGVRSR
jgi:glycerol-3-phosphate acyltransferase PlsY